MLKGPHYTFGTGENRHFKFGTEIDVDEYQHTRDRSRIRECTGSHAT